MISFIQSVQQSIADMHIPIIIIIGTILVFGLFVGKLFKKIKLPSLLGYMIVGVIFGTSVLHIISGGIQEHINFVSDIALGFIAFTIGIELKHSDLKRLGSSIWYIIFAESFGAFIIVTLLLWLITNNLALSLLFGAIAPASAPAGTVAVIQEYQAHGPLTKALYAVVGIDDGVGIIIFGFVFTIVQHMLMPAHNGVVSNSNVIAMFLVPLKEIGLSFGLGGILAVILKYFLNIVKKDDIQMYILLFAIILISIGLCTALHLSLILTNMILGLIIVNTTSHTIISKLGGQLRNNMPLLYILFFALAGAHLDIFQLPVLGTIGAVYIIGRTIGLMGGAKIGAIIGNAPTTVRRYLGYGILSQAGVAIGLSIMVAEEITPLGDEGSYIGTTIITTITITSIIFGIIGPLCTKFALQKAGEIDKEVNG